MQDEYYTIPMDLDRLVEGRAHTRCSLHKSVYQHIYLLLITHFGETRYDATFGCALWDHDFSIMSSLKWKDIIRESVEQTVARFEPRLSALKVKVEMEEYEVMTKANHYIRKRIGVSVEGTITRTKEPFRFFERVFISPMSAE